SAARAAAPSLAGRIKIFPNVIAAAALAAARAAEPDTTGASRAGPVRIGYIGRIHPEKGLALLVEAARRLDQRPDLPDWTLTLRGPVDVPRGGGGPAFVAELEKLGAPLITRGRLRLEPPEFSAEALARAYAMIDIFAYPSLATQGETFGVAIAEAMAS